MSLPKPIIACLKNKPLLLIIAICFLFVSCDYFKPYKVEKTAKNYLTDKVLKDGDYKVEVKKIKNDTLPFYLNANVYDDVVEFDKMWLDLMYLDVEDYSKLEDIYNDLVERSSNVIKKKSEIETKCYGIDKVFIVYLKARKNGLTTSDKYIVIIDSEETDRVICHIKFDEKIKGMWTNLMIPLRAPIELNEYDIIDLKEINKWYNNKYDYCEDYSNKVYNKHLKRFE